MTDPATKTASGSLSLLLPVDAAGETLAVGPAAFPAGAQVALSVPLPTDQATTRRDRAGADAAATAR